MIVRLYYRGTWCRWSAYKSCKKLHFQCRPTLICTTIGVVCTPMLSMVCNAGWRARWQVRLLLNMVIMVQSVQFMMLSCIIMGCTPPYHKSCIPRTSRRFKHQIWQTIWPYSKSHSQCHHMKIHLSMLPHWHQIFQREVRNPEPQAKCATAASKPRTIFVDHWRSLVPWPSLEKRWIRARMLALLDTINDCSDRFVVSKAVVDSLNNKCRWHASINLLLNEVPHKFLVRILVLAVASFSSCKELAALFPQYHSILVPKLLESSRSWM